MPKTFNGSAADIKRIIQGTTFTKTDVTAARPDDGRSHRIGRPYRPANANMASAVSELWSRDPDEYDRSSNAHSWVQNELSNFLLSNGIQSLEANIPQEPRFDIGWWRGTALYIAEVKSTKPSNEEKQLRLGLGQVLRYCSQLRQQFDDVRPVLVAEAEPADATWLVTCQQLGVLLSWPSTFPTLVGS